MANTPVATNSSTYQPQNYNSGERQPQAPYPSSVPGGPLQEQFPCQSGPIQQYDNPRSYQQDQRQCESYQGREASTRGNVNHTIPSRNHNSIQAKQMTYVEVLSESMSPLAFFWGWIGGFVIAGAVAMIVLAFLHSQSDYELAIGLMIGGVFCLLFGTMAFVKGTVTCYRNYKEKTSSEMQDPLLSS